MRISAAVLLVILSATAACDRAGDARPPVDDDPEVITVEEVERLPQQQVEALLRIDGTSENLVAIEWLGISPSGTIAVLQMQDQLVRFYDARGALLGTFGGKGAGPGEFERPVRAGWTGDSLWVDDGRLSRITLVSPDRELIRTWSRAAPIVLPAGPGGGARTLQYYPHAMYGGDTLIVTAFDTASGVLRITADGSFQNVVMAIPTPPARSVTAAFGTSEDYLRIPFVSQPFQHTSPDGSRTARLYADVDARTFDVASIDAAGDTVFKRRVHFEPVTIPGDSTDAAIDVQIARIPSRKFEFETKLQAAAPSVFPPVNDLIVSSEGGVWIGLRPGPDGTEWLVLDPAGTPVAIVVLPPRTRLRGVTGDRMLTVETDELDVESVVIYTVAPRPDAG